MNLTTKLKHWIVGPPHDPMKPETRGRIALIAFFAWVGLGADGLSSSCYGPEESYLALGAHTHFGLYLALARDNFLTRLLHNQVPLAMQRQLHLRGQQMVILPMKV